MSDSANAKPQRRLGDFEIVREIGRGGMGIVYEARQASLNRKVALKVLAGNLGLTSKAIVRFRREAETASSGSQKVPTNRPMWRATCRITQLRGARLPGCELHLGGEA